MNTHHIVRTQSSVTSSLLAVFRFAFVLGSQLPLAAVAHAAPNETATEPRAAAPQPTTADNVNPAPKAAQATTLELPASETVAPIDQEPKPFRLGAHAEVDLGILLALSQGTGLAAGVVWGPFRAGMSYASFLSNNDFGGTPEGFALRANYIVGFNMSYFIAQDTDEGAYVQAMFHIKQQGVTNERTGAHKDLDSLAAGLELGYVWKVYNGLYVCPRVGALYYVKSPQGPKNNPVEIGDRKYDNGRHKVFDTYYIPTLSVGYSW